MDRLVVMHSKGAWSMIPGSQVSAQRRTGLNCLQQDGLWSQVTTSPGSCQLRNRIESHGAEHTMKRRILLVEDEQELCTTLGDRICGEGYEVDFAHDGVTAVRKLDAETFDLIILDLMLPLKSGLDVCAEIREAQIRTPVIILTALNHTIEKIAGLKIGADDYVTKPFDTLELMARIEALLRRASLTPDSAAPSSHLVRVGNVTLDVRREIVQVDSELVNLTSREFQLLWYLVQRRGQTISRDELLEQIWGHVPGTLTRTVDMHIASLRHKMGLSPKDSDLIVTVPGRGYRYQL
jgi:two-component system alkaline phosphatase synthesis response regulator PhoP